MSSKSIRSTEPPSAPWKPQFVSNVQSMKSPEFYLANLHPAPKGSHVPFVPRVRTMIYRGMWAELPENSHYKGPENPAVYGSDCPTFTSDVRMQKLSDIFETCKGKVEDETQKLGSGGGGPVEAIWWVADKQQQWRIRGNCYIVGDDIEGTGKDGNENLSGVRTIKSEVGKRMRLVGDEDKAEGWSWQTEVTAHFGHMSPMLRGSFKNPPPGRPVSEVPQDPELKAGQKLDTIDDKVARKNFRVCIIVPDEVENLDLSNPPDSKRNLYQYVGEGQTGEGIIGGWKRTELFQ